MLKRGYYNRNRIHPSRGSALHGRHGNEGKPASGNGEKGARETGLRGSHRGPKRTKAWSNLDQPVDRYFQCVPPDRDTNRPAAAVQVSSSHDSLPRKRTDSEGRSDSHQPGIGKRWDLGVCGRAEAFKPAIQESSCLAATALLSSLPHGLE